MMWIIDSTGFRMPCQGTWSPDSNRQLDSDLVLSCILDSKSQDSGFTLGLP